MEIFTVLKKIVSGSHAFKRVLSLNDVNFFQQQQQQQQQHQQQQQQKPCLLHFPFKLSSTCKPRKVVDMLTNCIHFFRPGITGVNFINVLHTYGFFVQTLFWQLFSSYMYIEKAAETTFI